MHFPVIILLEVRVLLFNKDMSIAYKDYNCQYNVLDFSLFEIEKVNNKCSSLDIKLLRNKEIFIKVKCPICAQCHSYSYNIADFVKREMIIGGCEVFGLPLFLIGNSDSVKQIIDKYREANNKMYAMI